MQSIAFFRSQDFGKGIDGLRVLWIAFGCICRYNTITGTKKERQDF